MRSPWGRVLRSIREDEDAARSLGKNVYSYKMQSLVLGGVHRRARRCHVRAWRSRPSATGNLQPGGHVLPATVIVILGGAGRIVGPVLGSIIFWFVFSILGCPPPPTCSPAAEYAVATRIAIVGRGPDAA